MANIAGQIVELGAAYVIVHPHSGEGVKIYSWTPPSDNSLPSPPFDAELEIDDQSLQVLRISVNGEVVYDFEETDTTSSVEVEENDREDTMEESTQNKQSGRQGYRENQTPRGGRRRENRGSQENRGNYQPPEEKLQGLLEEAFRRNQIMLVGAGMAMMRAMRDCEENEKQSLLTAFYILRRRLYNYDNSSGNRSSRRRGYNNRSSQGYRRQRRD